MKLIENTRPVDDIDPERCDAIVVTGGQGPMFTFEAATNLHAKFTELYEARRICAALCHGVGLLRYARLSNGEPLVAGKTVTGFANVEENFTDQSVWDASALAPGTTSCRGASRTSSRRWEPTSSRPAVEGLRRP